MRILADHATLEIMHGCMHVAMNETRLCSQSMLIHVSGGNSKHE